MDAADAQAAAEVMVWHCASGAITRSTDCGLVGLAAGQTSIPSAEGMARPPLAVQDDSAGGGVAVPAGQAAAGAQAPEQAEEFRPAREPNVPAGQGEQTAAPASEKVPGEHSAHAEAAPSEKVPAGHLCDC